jgi:hypothetical protein
MAPFFKGSVQPVLTYPPNSGTLKRRRRPAQARQRNMLVYVLMVMTMGVCHCPPPLPEETGRAAGSGARCLQIDS